MPKTAPTVATVPTPIPIPVPATAKPITPIILDIPAPAIAPPAVNTAASIFLVFLFFSFLIC